MSKTNQSTPAGIEKAIAGAKSVLSDATLTDAIPGFTDVHGAAVGWWIGALGAAAVGTSTFIGSRRALVQKYATRFPVTTALGAPSASFVAAIAPTVLFYSYTPEIIRKLWPRLPSLPK